MLFEGAKLDTDAQLTDISAQFDTICCLKLLQRLCYDFRVWDVEVKRIICIETETMSEDGSFSIRQR